jgi:hypothetical protein
MSANNNITKDIDLSNLSRREYQPPISLLVSLPLWLMLMVEGVKVHQLMAVVAEEERPSINQ